jgi:hypothetical protein
LQPINASRDEIRQRQLSAQSQLSAYKFAIVAAFSAYIIRLDGGKLTAAKIVIFENVKRVFTGMEAAMAQLNITFKSVCFADFVLIPVAGPIVVKCFEGFHLSSPLFGFNIV